MTVDSNDKVPALQFENQVECSFHSLAGGEDRSSELLSSTFPGNDLLDVNQSRQFRRILQSESHCVSGRHVTCHFRSFRFEVHCHSRHVSLDRLMIDRYTRFVVIN